MRLRRSSLLLGFAIAFAGFTGTASAATLTNVGGVVTYTAEAGETNMVGFDEVAYDPATGATIEVRRQDGDDAEITATGCASEEEGTVFRCEGVTRLVANAGDESDMLDAAASAPSQGIGFDTLLVHVIVTMDLGPGDDFGGTGAMGDTLRGGDGSDFLVGDPSGGGGPGGPVAGAGNDTILGGAGNDFIQANRGTDQVDGEAGNDFVTGGPGDDTVRGGSDDDEVSGGPGADQMFGDAGNDRLEGECYFFPCGGFPGQTLGSDDMRGGGGIDTVIYFTQAAPGLAPPTEPVPGVTVRVTLDDVQNDGREGEPADNVRSDIEDVDLSQQLTDPEGNPDPFALPGNGVVIGSAGFNQIIGSDGGDLIDPAAGNDVVVAGAGDDTINVRDGYADRVACGAGADTVDADQLDILSDDCETPRRATTANANDVPEDRPPSLAWSTPASAQVLSTTTGNTLAVTASDDRGIAQVQFLDDERVVCVDTTAPYTCDYRPQGDDVGRNTLVAIAIDTAQQTTSAVRSVRVPLFQAPRLSATVRPGRDAAAPFRFTTSGRLTLPSGVSAGLGCKGTVAVQFKAGKKTISTRRVQLTRSCTYRSRVTFRIPSRLNPRRLRVFVRFAGNDVIQAKRAARKSVRVR